VLVTSGTATDGMLLPLPSGVTAQEVSDGRAVLHVQVTPRIPPVSGMLLRSAVEAGVDADRRVRCRIRTYDLQAAPPAITEGPGAVDFLVLAAVAATNGGA
jgi:hypothetical protein